ncbi:hypothetical protein Nepgr_027482 [Nepenthes gracilis]|uniref:PDZ domain-containing protein n=1 Tax=Nepenthes gracilis TaxID=150966 RepID=A0AAD3TAV9_NEPGR|nr:hypothetical protein Nepgr_027482 [Nepenthes gracilis]
MSSSSSIWGSGLGFFNGGSFTQMRRLNRSITRFYAMSTTASSYRMNLNEYMVTVEKPLGIRFALSVDGKIFVHALQKGGNAEKSRIIMVGDTLKKASDSSDGRFIEIKDIGDTQNMLKEKAGSFSLILDRPFTPFPIKQLHLTNDLDILFNRGRVPVATWNSMTLASNLQASSETNGNSGFVVFSSRFLAPKAWNILSDHNGNSHSLVKNNILASPISQIVCIFSEEGSQGAEWSHGSFPLEEYTKALDRSKGELHYNHSLGVQCSKV